MSDPLPANGSIYSFRTAPFSDFAPQTTGRFAALKVLGANASHVVVAVLDSIWRTPPSLDDVRTSIVLREHRFFHTGRAAAFGINVDSWNLQELEEMKLLGTMTLTAEELQFASNIFGGAPGSTFSTLRAVNHAAEGEWRWANDRDTLVDEQQKMQAQQAAKRAAQEERYRSRLRGLTWEQLLDETPFERWSSSPPFPWADFTTKAREVIHNACRALQALGSKPRKADVRNVLRNCVQWFNKADEKAGGVIETEERGDICAVLEEMAHVARQKALVDEIDNWRTW